jgi:hypothetical protein
LKIYYEKTARSFSSDDPAVFFVCIHFFIGLSDGILQRAGFVNAADAIAEAAGVRCIVCLPES